MSRPADEPPSPADVAGAFHVAAVRRDGDTVRYFGDPLVPPDAVVDELAPLFARRGFDLRLERQSATGTTDGGHDLVSAPSQPYALVAEPATTGHDGVPWLNVALLLATIGSALYVGASSWYYIPVTEQPLRVFEAWPFVAAMLGVLGIHELGHYAAARYYGVDVTLPYFIPFPSLLGTLGAVINIRGQIPDRRALFDIGVAGPLAGLVATVVVTVVGLTLEPITVPQSVLNGGAEYAFRFHDPLLMQGLQGFVEFVGWGVEYGPNEAVHPVVFAGWAGMFFTFLNLLPVGQLDGGHIVRAIVGQRQETIAAAVPGALFALAGFLYLTRDAPPIGFGVWSLWAFWGLFSTGLAYAGPARPTVDEPLDRRRTLLGVATFALGIACFTPVPFEIVLA
ncbi:site-2 protease family protein [Halomicroarcula sp. F13]|uniref:Site-2 protease family protein n=1 Tax=Haloarcula rubra TaxID=2487747 RepID=A0AAW4PUZ1_9EURY|nr:site-2 protease family protein [Halomicroarcula rubra]MBX0324082.1 site-2 protease family protein [Halomicroarcula rubra]